MQAKLAFVLLSLVGISGCAVDGEDPAARAAACADLGQAVYAAPDADLPALTSAIADTGCEAGAQADYLGALTVERITMGADRVDVEAVAEGFVNLALLDPARVYGEAAPGSDVANFTCVNEKVTVGDGKGGCTVYHYGCSTLTVCRDSGLTR